MGLFGILRKSNTANIENISIQRMLPKMKEWKTDTIMISTNTTCSNCKMYNRKIYSLYGWNNKYQRLPDCLKARMCPKCHNIIGATMYFEGINKKPN